MQIYLIRHGDAEDRRPGGTDAQRVLSAKGRETVRQVLERARAAGAAPTVILCSPLVRAVETAAIAAEVLGYTGEAVRTEALMSDANPAALWEEVRARRGEPAILAAGHEPHMSAAVAYLLGAPTLAADMRKAAMVRLDIDRMAGEPRGVLKWMVTPDVAG